jgi:hypothetical protein
MLIEMPPSSSALSGVVPLAARTRSLRYTGVAPLISVVRLSPMP